MDQSMKFREKEAVMSSCRYAVTRGTFPLSSQYWEEGDVYEQRSTRDTAQATDTSTR